MTKRDTDHLGEHEMKPLWVGSVEESNYKVKFCIEIVAKNNHSHREPFINWLIPN